MSFSGMVKEELSRQIGSGQTLQDCGTGCNFTFLWQTGMVLMGKIPAYPDRK